MGLMTLNKTTKILLTFILGVVMMLSFNSVQSEALGDVNVSVSNGQLNVSGGGMDYSDADGAWNGFLTKYKNFISGFSGIGAISMIAFFIFNFMKLGAVSTNPSERAKVLQGLIWSGIAAAGLGAVSIIVGFFYGVLK